MLDAPTRQVLTTHYELRSSWSPGITAMLGTVADVPMAKTSDRARLEVGCCHSTVARIRR